MFPCFFSIVSNGFPLQRWDVPAGKQPGPAELYPEVELAPWWRYSVVAKGREGFGKKQILWIYISISMVVYKYCIKYRVTHMYIFIYTYTYSCIIYIYNMRSYRHPMQIKGCNNLHWCSYPSCHGPSKAHCRIWEQLSHSKYPVDCLILMVMKLNGITQQHIS